MPRGRRKTKTKEAEVKMNDEEIRDEATNSVKECAICLEPLSHPVRLPCSHIFCFLCAKGISSRNKKCAMCRKSIPDDTIRNPKILSTTVVTPDSNTVFDDGFQWFYEGQNGWWQYDERTSVEIETNFKNKDNLCQLLIAGFIYIIDFDQMIQYRQGHPGRKRKIKRDKADISKKGIAGIPGKNEPDVVVPSNSSKDLNNAKGAQASSLAQCTSAHNVSLDSEDEI